MKRIPVSFEIQIPETTQELVEHLEYNRQLLPAVGKAIAKATLKSAIKEILSEI